MVKTNLKKFPMMSKTYFKKGSATIVQGAIVQGDNCPRDFCPRDSCPRRLLSKEDFCPSDSSPRRLLSKEDFCPRRQILIFLSKELLLQKWRKKFENCWEQKKLIQIFFYYSWNVGSVLLMDFCTPSPWLIWCKTIFNKAGWAAEQSGPEKRGTGSPIETKKNNVNTIRNTLQNIGSSPIKSVRWLPCLRSAPWVYFTMLG